jgi:hypothetical protein
MKQIIGISHCVKIISVCFGFYIKRFKNMANRNPPVRTLLPHTIMAAPLVNMFLAF